MPEQGICAFACLLQYFCDLPAQPALRMVATSLRRLWKKVGRDWLKLLTCELWKTVLLMVALGCHGIEFGLNFTYRFSGK